MNFHPGGVDVAAFASLHGFTISEQGRVYRPGVALTFSKKVAISIKYLKAQELGACRPNILALSRECNVSRASMLKVERELLTFGRVLDPDEIRANLDIPTGPGSKSLSDLDALVILLLYHKEPSRTLSSYQIGLYFNTGSLVHESTISKFFNHGFPIWGSLCKPNLIPYDKLKPRNLDRALDYLVTMAMFDRTKIKRH